MLCILTPRDLLKQAALALLRLRTLHFALEHHLEILSLISMLHGLGISTRNTLEITSAAVPVHRVHRLGKVPCKSCAPFPVLDVVSLNMDPCGEYKHIGRMDHVITCDHCYPHYSDVEHY